jgi:hypothetical protein
MSGVGWVCECGECMWWLGVWVVGGWVGVWCRCFERVGMGWLVCGVVGCVECVGWTDHPGFEPVTFSLPFNALTTELMGQIGKN